MKVEIKNGKAVEVNTLGKKPEHYDYDEMISSGHYSSSVYENRQKEIDSWQQAEAARKVYEVDLEHFKNRIRHKMNDGILNITNVSTEGALIFLNKMEGSIHDAELINETTVKII